MLVTATSLRCTFGPSQTALTLPLSKPQHCKITGEVPGYGTGVDDMGHPVHNQQDWQQGVVIIDDYGDGLYQWRTVNITEGVAFMDGVMFDGNA